MNANDSDNGAPLSGSKKRQAANRANARKSTGPKTKAGKALVALNSVAHGIYSVSPVIEELESKRGWTAYRLAMLDNLAPVGMLEMTLVERVIFTAWRLRRVARFETEQIRLKQEGAAENVGRELKYELGLDDVDVKRILEEPEWREWRRRTVSALSSASDDTQLLPEWAEDLLWFIHEQLGETKQFESYWKQIPAPEAWNFGLIRQLIRGLSEKRGVRFDELLNALSTRAAAEHAKSLDNASLARASLEDYQREHLLPGAHDLEKIQRYESHLSRQFHRDLHELQRLQAMRLGNPVTQPIAIDIDVAGESKELGEGQNAMA